MLVNTLDDPVETAQRFLKRYCQKLGKTIDIPLTREHLALSEHEAIMRFQSILGDDMAVKGMKRRMPFVFRSNGDFFIYSTKQAIPDHEKQTLLPLWKMSSRAREYTPQTFYRLFGLEAELGHVVDLFLNQGTTDATEGFDLFGQIYGFDFDAMELSRIFAKEYGSVYEYQKQQFLTSLSTLTAHYLNILDYRTPCPIGRDEIRKSKNLEGLLIVDSLLNTHADIDEAMLRFGQIASKTIPYAVALDLAGAHPSIVQKYEDIRGEIAFYPDGVLDNVVIRS